MRARAGQRKREVGFGAGDKAKVCVCPRVRRMFGVGERVATAATGLRRPHHVARSLFAIKVCGRP